MDIGVEEIRKWHTEERGWSDIGYHVVIRRNGDFEEGREVSIAGAHCKGQNSNSIGICLVGGYNGKFDFTSKQMMTLDEVIRGIKESVAEVVSVHGHYEFSDKTCPNFDVKEWVKK